MIPSSPIMTLTVLGWFAVVSAASVTEEQTYAQVGGKVTLKPKPGSVTDATTSITWKVGEDLAAELEDGALQYYRDFTVRGELNNQTGEFTIKSLTYADSKVYTIEIGGNPNHYKIHLHVLSPVPVPTIRSSWSQDGSTCILTCDGNTTRAEPVEYSWTHDDTEVADHSKKTYTVEESSDVRMFTCKIQNPLGEESSKPFSNPVKPHPPEGGPKISTGVTVAIILLVAVIMVVIFHRLKTGECFFNKNSMPWEADFWRKTQGQQPQAAASESNGTTSPSLKRQSDEEETMMDG